MPDTKLTLQNLKDHFRRYATVYAALLIVAAVASNLLWTTTTPRVPEDERVVIYLTDAYSNVEPLKPLAATLLAQGQADDPALREVSFESLMFADPETDYTGVMVLLARLAAGEGDLFLAGPDAMDALVSAGACLPLDDYYAAGWMSDSGLEPYYAEYADPNTGEVTLLLAGFRLDRLNALADMGAFKNAGGFMCVAVNGTNLETTLRTAEALAEALLKESEEDA